MMRNVNKIKILAVLCFTFLSTTAFCQLNGIYTIGTGGNYLTIAAAVNALVTNGVNGPVTFDILTGSYDEQITIDSVPGTNNVNKVIFRSQSGNASDVIWLSSLDSRTFMLKINGADYIAFNKITFKDWIIGNYFLGRTISLQPNSENIIIGENIFDCIRITGPVFAFIESFSSNINSLLIKENTFGGIAGNTNIFGIKLSGSSSFTGINSNSFTDIWHSISVSNCDSILIEKNIISNTDIDLAGRCLELSSCNGSIIISKNTLIANSFLSSGRCLVLQNCTPGTALVSNNFISGVFSHGISSLNSKHVKYFHNTVYCARFSNNFDFTNSDSNYVMNNIMICRAGSFWTSYPMVVQNSVIFSDHNKFNFDVGFFGKLNGTVLGTLMDWQTATGNDSHSNVTPVSTVTYLDLHLSDSSIGDESLIGILLPEVPDDIDGELRSTFFPYMGADEAAVLLPVSLASFTSSVNANNVTLFWTTSFETNNSGFDIERKKITGSGLHDWSKIGSVQGNSITNIYSFSDYGLASGKYNYRLKQIDYNGKFEYFYLINEVFIGIPGKYSLSQNYPNPFNPSTNIDLNLPIDGNVTIRVFDMTGQEVKILVNEFRNAGYYTLKFNGEYLPSGIYFYTIIAGDFRDSEKMILLK